MQHVQPGRDEFSKRSLQQVRDRVTDASGADIVRVVDHGVRRRVVCEARQRNDPWRWSLIAGVGDANKRNSFGWLVKNQEELLMDGGTTPDLT